MGNKKTEGKEVTALALDQTRYDRFIFKKNGGKVEQCPYKEPRPRQFETAPIIHKVKQKATGSTDRPTRDEVMSAKLNIQSPNLEGGAATTATTTTGPEVFAGLAMAHIEKLRKHHLWGRAFKQGNEFAGMPFTESQLKTLVQDLYYYKHSPNLETRGKIQSKLFYVLVDRKLKHRWDTRKGHKILDAIAHNVIKNVCDPRHYQRCIVNEEGHKLSCENMASLLGISSGDNYKRYWRARYETFLSEVTDLDIQASEELKKQV